MEQQRTRRLKKKVVHLSAVVDDLREKSLISSDCAEILEKTFSGVPLEVMQRLLCKKQQKAGKQQYSQEIRSFAMTLHFYSAKAYDYVRETFDLCLPAPSTMRTWFAGVNGDPGFSQHAMQSLKDKTRNGEQVLVSLMLDEMAIRKKIEWDAKGQKMVGFVDLGTGVDDDSAPVATEALVFMVVCVNGSWKLPVGHFMIKSLTGEERANLVKECLVRLSDTGVTVTSLTCDGPSCHISMMKALGATIDANNLKTGFPNPTKPSETIYAILDVCHMLKLARTTLATCGIIVDGAGNQIRWQYIKDLHELQEKEGLRLANKLKSAHIHWKSQKMKVNLAAQTLSASVATALSFCEEQLQLAQFSGCDATCKFIKIFDELFDILNSRNPLGKGSKAPLKPENEAIFLPFLENAGEYIKSLKTPEGKPLTASTRKTAMSHHSSRCEW